MELQANPAAPQSKMEQDYETILEIFKLNKEPSLLFSAYELESKNMTYLKKLLEIDASEIDATNDKGFTFLMLQAKNVANFTYLIEKGANPHICHCSGYNLFILVTKFRAPIRILEILAENKVDPNVPLKDGIMYPIFYEVEHHLKEEYLKGEDSTRVGTVERIELLLKAGANPSIKKKTTGCTPLMESVYHNVQAPKIVELLCKFGADVNATNHSGSSYAIIFLNAAKEIAEKHSILKSKKTQPTEIPLGLRIETFILPIFKIIIDYGLDLIKCNFWKYIITNIPRMFAQGYFVPLFKFLLDYMPYNAKDKNPFTLFFECSLNWDDFTTDKYKDMIQVFLQSPYKVKNMEIKFDGLHQVNTYDMLSERPYEGLGLMFQPTTKENHEIFDIITYLYTRIDRHEMLQEPNRNCYDMVSKHAEFRKWWELFKKEGFETQTKETRNTTVLKLMSVMHCEECNYMELISLMEDFLNDGVSFNQRVYKFKDAVMQKLSDELQVPDVLVLSLYQYKAQQLAFLLKYWNQHPLTLILLLNPMARINYHHQYGANHFQFQRTPAENLTLCSDHKPELHCLVRGMCFQIQKLMKWLHKIGGSIPHGTTYYNRLKQHLEKLDAHIKNFVYEQFDPLNLMQARVCTCPGFVRMYDETGGYFYWCGRMEYKNYIMPFNSLEIFSDLHRQPVSLQHMCRTVIRSSCKSGNDLPSKLRSIVPYGLEDFVTYNEISPSDSEEGVDFKFEHNLALQEVLYILGQKIEQQCISAVNSGNMQQYFANLFKNRGHL